MIRKFNKVQSVGVLRDSPTKGDVEFRRLNLVHGENGRGKSTLVAILRSLQNGNNNLVLERKTLDDASPPFVEVLTDTGPIRFRNGAWDGKVNKLDIFDAQFVTENVFAGDAITHDHKRNLCRIVLGADGVELAAKFDEYDGHLRTASGAISAAKDVIAGIRSPGDVGRHLRRNSGRSRRG